MKKQMKKTGFFVMMALVLSLMFGSVSYAADAAQTVTEEQDNKVTVNQKSTAKQLVAEANASITKANQNVQFMMKIVLILIAVCIVLLFIILNTALKNRDLKADIRDLERENVKLSQAKTPKKKESFRPLPAKKFTGTRNPNEVGPVREEEQKMPEKKPNIPQDIFDPEDVVFPEEGPDVKPAKKPVREKKVKKPAAKPEVKPEEEKPAPKKSGKEVKIDMIDL